MKCKYTIPEEHAHCIGKQIGQVEAAQERASIVLIYKQKPAAMYSQDLHQVQVTHCILQTAQAARWWRVTVVKLLFQKSNLISDQKSKESTYYAMMTLIIFIFTFTLSLVYKRLMMCIHIFCSNFFRKLFDMHWSYCWNIIPKTHFFSVSAL